MIRIGFNISAVQKNTKMVVSGTLKRRCCTVLGWTAFERYACLSGPRQLSRYSVYTTGWTVRGSNTGGGLIFRTCSDRPWGPPSFLCNGYRVSFPGVKRPGRGANHPPQSNAEVKERVGLYFPSGPFWSVLGGSLHFQVVDSVNVVSHARETRILQV